MEKTIHEAAQNLEPAPERAEYPVECPTCMSGIDPTVGIGLFQEALLESL
jgi:hypothetical protein